MDKVYIPSSIGQAVAFVLFKNPARSRSFNPFEQEGSCKPSHEQFSGLHPNDLHAKVLKSIQAVEKLHGVDFIFFALLYGLNGYDAIGYNEVVKSRLFFYSEKTIKRRIRSMKEDLERELRARGAWLDLDEVH